MGAKKLSPVAQAYERSDPVRKALYALEAEGLVRNMECTEDKCGIVWERWCVLSGKMHTGASIVVFATPSWWEVFGPISRHVEIDKTVAALQEYVRG